MTLDRAAARRADLWRRLPDIAETMNALPLVRRAGLQVLGRSYRGGFPDHGFIAAVAALDAVQLRQFAIAVSNASHYCSSQADFVSGVGLPVMLGLAGFGLYTDGRALAFVTVVAVAYLACYAWYRILAAVAGACQDAITRLVGDTPLGQAQPEDPE